MKIQELIGQTLSRIDGAVKWSEEIVFTLVNGRIFHMWHNQQCCESVMVEDICGSIEDLVGSPIVRAENPSSEDDPKSAESGTWTFYILATIRGTVTFRWLGTRWSRCPSRMAGIPKPLLSNGCQTGRRGRNSQG